VTIPELEARYPKALRHVECGFCIGDGWLPLMVPVLEVCEAEGVEIVQVKNKFGLLRVYAESYSVGIDAAIALAERLSGQTCENCGKPSARSGRGLCDAC
jgi:hypothetical protein